MSRKIIHFLARFLFRLLSRLEITGIENVPAGGAVILAVNHLGRLDAPLVFALIDRTDLTALVTTKYQKNLFFRWLVNGVQGIWINREDIDAHALKASVNHLRQGGALGIAPEGTRSSTGALLPAKTGTAFLADKAGVPIVPVAITGTEIAVQNLMTFKRPEITIRFGPPFRLPPLDRKDRTASLQHNTGEIMYRIAAMLPPEYRGVYAGHPAVGDAAVGELELEESKALG